jgi:hypothetical protein
VAVVASCWEWHGAKRTGYGLVHFEGRVQSVHRLSYEALVGPIPAGLQLDHLCRNRACYNPAHLEPVTNRENKRRGTALVTSCPQGHEYSEENTYVHNSHRFCRTCSRNRVPGGGRPHRS